MTSVVSRMHAHLRPAWGLLLLFLRMTAQSWFTMLFYSIALPIICFVIFSADADLELRRRMLLGNVMFSIVMVYMRVPSMDAVFEREAGLFDLLGTTGATKTTYLLAKAFELALLAFMPMTVLVYGAVSGSLGHPASFVWPIPLVIGAVSLMAFALVIAATSPSIPAAGLLSNFAVMASLCLCPLVYPADRVPPLIRPITAVLPPTLTIEMFEGAWVGGRLAAGPLALLVAWTALLGTYGWRRFRWTEPT